MGLVFVLPPSLGHAKAAARGELIEAALARELDQPVTAVIAESYSDLEGRALRARAELVWAPAAVCAQLVAARAVFTIVREGQASYRSALIARRDEALTLASLAGRRAAWVDPLSAGGYLLATALLRARNIDPDRVFASQAFVGSHRAAVEAVLHGEADVAAVSAHSIGEEGVAAMLRWYVGPMGAELDAIAVTEVCPNDAIVLTTKLTEAEADAIVERLVPSPKHPRAGARLLSGLAAEGLQRAELQDYRRAFSFATPGRRSVPPGPAR